MKKNSGFELRKVGEETILIATGIENIDFNNIINMNKSAALLWNKIGDKEFDCNMLADILVDHYKIDMNVAVIDTEDIIQQWVNAGIIST